MAVVVESLLKLVPLFEDVAKVGVGLGQEGVLLDGQSAKMCRPERKKTRKGIEKMGKKQESIQRKMQNIEFTIV